jgi:hypothetical protein
METLAAVGLAGNIVQFVQVAGQLISEANAIRKNGSPSSLAHLRDSSESLVRQAEMIKTGLKSKPAPFGREDQVLFVRYCC